MFTGNLDWSKIILYPFCLFRPVLLMRIVDDVFQRTFIKPHLIRFETFGHSVPELHRLLSTSEIFCSCRSVIESTSCRVDECTCSQRKGWQTKADLCFVSRKSRKTAVKKILFEPWTLLFYLIFCHREHFAISSWISQRLTLWSLKDEAFVRSNSQVHICTEVAS